jgi:glucose/arabinose dehydrogenase
MAPRPGTTDVYVTERAGRVRRLTVDGDRFAVDPAPVLDIEDLVGGTSGERGLLGLTFDPDGSHLYVSYTATPEDGSSVVAAYDMDGATPDARTRREVLRVAQPEFTNHKGGNVVFGPDGNLWVGFGDGGSQGDPSGNGQNTGVLLAKLLRIDPRPESGASYSVPADNPFVGDSSKRREIWAYGLRNPWRFSFDRATGDLWIADVGGSEWEEVDYLPAADGLGKGANFGWQVREGAHATGTDGDSSGMKDPIFEYGHDEGSSIIGGFVYRGSAIPQLAGTYLFSDFAAATLRGLTVRDGRLDQEHEIATRGAKMSAAASFGQDLDGELYVLNLTGDILKLVPA